MTRSPRHISGFVSVAALLLLSIAGCASDSEPRSDQPSQEDTSEATSAPSPSEEAPVEEEPVADEPPARADSWKMPNEVGKGLQEAQDDIQGLTGNPFFYTSSEDATGQDRFQVFDRNWKVCSQKPAPGARFDEDTDITFVAVKLNEKCP